MPAPGLCSARRALCRLFMIHRFILIETSHAGNVGATARAMLTMGFDDLVLVRPRQRDVLHLPETIQRASGAQSVLERARVVQTLDEALHGITHLCATVMTARDFGPPTREVREHFSALAPTLQGSINPTPPTQQQAHTGVAVLFGCERFGMSNADVYRCHVALRIATNPQFGSLNLAAAVQLVAHEWRQALGGFATAATAPSAPQARQSRLPHADLADLAQTAAMLAHWQQALVHIGYLDPAAPKKLMPRLQQMFGRAQLTQQEIHILRGIARSMLRTPPVVAPQPGGQLPSAILPLPEAPLHSPHRDH